MGMEEIVNLATQAGLSVVIILYFLYKDYKFNENIITVLTEVKEVLILLKEYHNVE